MTDVFDGFPGPPDGGLAGEWWAWQAAGELRMQRCAGCGQWRHPPTEVCPECWSRDLVWQPVAGTGTVFSWTRTHHPFVPEVGRAVPYLCAVVELDEGPRLLAGLRPADPSAAVEVGQRVGLAFETRGGTRVAVWVPQVPDEAASNPATRVDPST